MLIFKPLEPARRDVVLDVRRGGVRSRVSRKPFSHLLVFPARVPDSSISDSTSGITTYQYDGLNRVTLVAPGAVFALSFREAKRRGNPLSARDTQHWTTMGWSILSSKQEEAAAPSRDLKKEMRHPEDRAPSQRGESLPERSRGRSGAELLRTENWRQTEPFPVLGQWKLVNVPSVSGFFVRASVGSRRTELNGQDLLITLTALDRPR